MANLFRARANSTNPVAVGLRIQSSVQGTAIPIGCGLTRWAPILIDYAGFTATPTKSPGSKGGVLGSGGKGNTGQYNYTASGLMLLGEGLVQTINTAYNGTNFDFLVAPSAQTIRDLAAMGIPSTDWVVGNPANFTLHTGDYSQTVDSFWSASYGSAPVGRALGYRGLSYIVAPNVGLGTSPTWPSWSFEALWGLNTDIPALGPDANPADWIQAFLTNADWGVQGFPSSAIGDFNTARNYWRATGMLISLALTSPGAANSHLVSLMQALNCEFRWSGGSSGMVLDIVPYGDIPVSGNGYAYTPNVTPVYDFGPDDFLPNQGSLGSATGSGYVSFERTSVFDVFNKLQVEYLDRSNLYNPVTIYQTDDATIISQGGRFRLSDLKQNHFFNLGSAASTSIALQLQRIVAGINTYQCTVGRQFILLDPLDKVTLTEPALQLVNQLCLITEIQENADRTRTMTFEEVPLTAGAPLYARQSALGAARNANAPSGSVNTPYFFEPPAELGLGLVLLIGLSGVNADNFGGCQVWISSDNLNYEQLGVFNGATRMGVLTASLATFTAAASGNTVDSTNTLAVNLAESQGSLMSVSTTSFAALATVSVVDNEVLAYQTASLTGASAYNLTTLARGAYGSTIAAHAVGAPFMRLDSAVFEWQFPANYVGQTVYFKFLAFNAFGNGIQNIANVGAYPFSPTGESITAPLANVMNIYANFEAGFEKIYWDEIVDFRSGVIYEIRQGATWAGGLFMCTQAHPPYIARGNGTYWIAARCTPTAGLTVYSATPQSFAIAGNQLLSNIVDTFDEQAAGWTGTITAGLGTTGVGATEFLRFGVTLVTTATSSTTTLTFASVPATITPGMGVSNSTKGTSIPAGTTVVSKTGTTVLLTNAASGVLIGDDIIFTVGTLVATGPIPINQILYYTATAPIDIGYSAQASVNVNTIFAGVPVGSNLLTIPNLLTTPDILGSASTQYITAWAEISIGGGAFVKFTPGVFVGRTFNFRIAMETSDPNSIPFCEAFSYTVQVPFRVDHFQNQSIAAGGTAIAFRPDGAAAAPFNSGPNGAALPYYNVSWQPTAGDTYVISAFTLSGLTIQFFNPPGTGVARTGVNIDIEGF